MNADLEVATVDALSFFTRNGMNGPSRKDNS